MDDQEIDPSNVTTGTIVCPKEKYFHYFRQACETLIRPSGIRPWCKRCQHFASDRQPPPEVRTTGGETC